MDDTLPDDPAPSTADLERVVEETRRLIELLVTAEAPDDVLAAAEREIRAAADRLAPFRAAAGRRSTPVMTAADPGAIMPFDFVVGALSPLAPPLRVRWEPPMAVAETTFSAAYEGPPGCVHGGIIAAAFDQVFNVANLMLGAPGPTATLQLRYRRPTPLASLLRFEAWQERVEERRVYLRGRLLAGSDVTVEAEGAFARLPVERIMALLGTPGPRGS
jgi:acyl-coenzyme A thioesterase PaaI-like protein